MKHRQRLISATLVCAALAIGATACSSGGSKSTAGSGASASAAPSAPAAPADPLAALSGPQIATKAIADLKAATSLHMVGAGTDDGSKVSFDLHLAPAKGCQGSVSLGTGKGSIQLLVIGQNVWFEPDATFWMANGGNATVVKLLGGKYLQTTASSSGMASVASLCNISQTMVASVGNVSATVKGPESALDGQQVVKLSDPTDATAPGTIYVTDVAAPEIVQLVTTGSDAGVMNFDEYGQPITLTPPPAADTVLASKYGL